MNLLEAEFMACRLLAKHLLLGWRFEFNSSKTEFGRTVWLLGGGGRVELSSVFTPHRTADEVRDTVLHEIAHALTGPEHGEEWRMKCRELGCEPEPKSASPQGVGRWRATCNCGKAHFRWQKPKEGYSYHCVKCDGILTWVEFAGLS